VSFGQQPGAQTNSSQWGEFAQVSALVLAAAQGATPSGFFALALARSVPSRSAGSFAPWATTTRPRSKSKNSRGHPQRKGSPHPFDLPHGERASRHPWRRPWEALRWPHVNLISGSSLPLAPIRSCSRSALHIRGSACLSTVRLLPRQEARDLPPQGQQGAFTSLAAQLPQTARRAGDGGEVTLRAGAKAYRR